MTSVAIVDYRLCNLDSLRRAVEECGGNPLVTSNAADLANCDRIILPGVGSFARAMANLTTAGFTEALPEAVADGRPLLGVCLGMHLLAEAGTEGGDTPGLGLLGGSVRKLTPSAGERVPHIGWNNVSISKSSHLFTDVADDTDFYFVHGYCLDAPAEQTLGTVDYCGSTVAAAGRENVMAVQFHPEKSQTAGFRLIKNFLGL